MCFCCFPKVFGFAVFALVCKTSVEARLSQLVEEMEEEGPATAQDRREQEQEMKAFRDRMCRYVFFVGGELFEVFFWQCVVKSMF